MATTKLKDSVFKTVVVTLRNPETEDISGFVGSNMVIINGKPEIKHYRFELGKEVKLPDVCIKQLRARSQVMSIGANGKSVKLYSVEEIKLEK